jgi:hypothetical protein
MQYVAEVQALPELDAAAILDDIDMHLRNAIRAQGDYQRQTDEAERFKDILRACFASGEVHVCDRLNQGPPQFCPHTWGWRRPAADDDLELSGCGSQIGYIDEPRAELWLIPDAAYRAVQRFASQQNEPFLVSQPTLWRRLQERGGLLASERDPRTGTMRPTVKKAVGGRRERVLVLSTATVTGNDKADE